MSDLDRIKQEIVKLEKQIKENRDNVIKDPDIKTKQWLTDQTDCQLGTLKRLKDIIKMAEDRYGDKINPNV